MSDTVEIEREIFIAAAPATLFRFFVEPELMAQWFGRQHSLDPRPGGIFRVELGGSAVARGTYRDIAPPHRVAFTWGWEGRDDLPPDRSLVEITLEPRPGGTLVRLRHSGLPAAAKMPFLPEEHGKRWTHYLAQLAQACTTIAPKETSWT